MKKARWFLFVFVWAITNGSSAQGGNPFDAEEQRLAGLVSRAGSNPSGILPLLELWRNWDDATPTRTLPLLERLQRDSRLSPDRRSYVGALLARAYLRVGRVADSESLTSTLGYASGWKVVGPFDNEGKRGFPDVMPPELAQNEPADPAARWAGRERPVSWRTYPETSRFGYVNFDAIYRPNENTCAFAQTYVTSESAQKITLWLGNGGAAKVWWNGQLVLTDEKYRQPDPDRHVVTVDAAHGVNRVLVKVCVASATWGFFFRIGDVRGGAPQGIDFTSTPPNGEIGPAAPAEQVVFAEPADAVKSPLSIFESRAAQEEAPAAALEELARFLAFSGADDAAERRAKQLAAQAVEKQATLPRLILAAQLADERAEVQRFAAQAVRLFGNQPGALLLQARVLEQGPDPREALPILSRIPARTTAWMEGKRIEARVALSAGMTHTALAAIREAERLAHDSPGWAQAVADAASTADRKTLAMEFLARVIELRYDDTSARLAALNQALVRGDETAAIGQLDVLRTLSPDSTSTWLLAAKVHDAFEHGSAAIEAYRAALSIAPEDASLHNAFGQYLLRVGQTDAAYASLSRARELRPQDAEVRELLEELQPTERPDESYAANEETLLQRRSNGSGYPISVLEDLTVNTVYENGLGSSYKQMAVQLHDEEAARRWRTYPIQFDPGSQRVEVRRARVYRNGRTLEAADTFEQPLGEPWYRIYYDTRALIVVFPDLEPGDVVEVQYRVDDIAAQNMFRDYYGDLHVLASQYPIKSLHYVLITPAQRSFHFNEPRVASLRKRERVEGATRITEFSASNIAAIEDEEGMPGATEIAPYLHVSTYRTWQDVGHWYWGLIRDQLYADEHLKRVVADLVRGAPDTSTKVTRIYDWVVRNTRYVGLEFGIHGFLPYRVPLIVQRGFGDCKDKASLIYTMLREAGIDARIVLVRTRRNGAIHDLPASLSVFDHAIAYVPELDLFLDGTAENSGSREFPNMDQGVTVLIVGPESAELRQSPVLPAEHNLVRSDHRFAMREDGSAALELEVEINGGNAARYRERFQAEGTRKDRLERDLRGRFPGLTIDSQSFSDLSNRELPVTYRATAQVPQLAVPDNARLRAEASSSTDFLRAVASAPSRRHPLDLGSTQLFRETREIAPPAGWRVAAAPQAARLESEFGRVVIETERKADGSVVVKTEIAIVRDRIEAADYPAFRTWAARADERLREPVLFERGER